MYVYYLCTNLHTHTHMYINVHNIDSVLIVHLHEHNKHFIEHKNSSLYMSVCTYTCFLLFKAFTSIFFSDAGKHYIHTLVEDQFIYT